MNTIKRVCNYLFIGSLLFIAQFAFADSSSISGVAFGSDQVKNYTDLSISYLSQILGTVGNVLHGTSGQILGQMFYVFNTGVLIAAGIWLCYTVLTVLLKSSQEGSFQGQNRNAAVIFLKIALGIAFLVPSPSTGYNVLQAIVAKVVVAGVDLADSTWNKALDYMSEGGTIFSLNSVTKEGEINSKVISPTDLNNAIKAVRTILSSTTCFYQANSTRKVPANMIVDTAHHELQFPGPGDDPTALSLTHPSCGSISWDIGGYCSKAGTAEDKNGTAAIKCSIYQQAIYQVVTDLWQTGLSYANYYPVKSDDQGTQSTALTTDDLSAEGQTAIVNALIDYINLGMAATHVDAVQNPDDKNDESSMYNFYKNTARKDGWIMAGAFYWQLVNYNEDISKDDPAAPLDVPISQDDGNDQSIAIPTSTSQAQTSTPTVFGPDTDILVNNYKTANQAIVSLSAETMTDTLLKEASSLDPSLDDKNFKADTMSIPTNVLGKMVANKSWAKGVVKLGTGVLGGIMDTATGPIRMMSDLFSTLTNTNTNPLLWTQKVGQAMLKTASAYTSAAMLIFPVLGALGGWILNLMWMGIGASYDVSPFFKMIAGMLKLLVLPLVFICLLGGIILAYYLPLYPYFLFLFGVASWLFHVIEGMLAAPLVALGLTHPEGHDFLGKAEQALILLLNLFVRPVLMVFGLIVGIVVSYVLFELVQHSIMIVLGTIGYQHDFGTKFSMGAWFKTINGKYGFLSPMILLLILTMYIYVVYQCVVKAYSGISAFPNKILRWIGGFEQQDDSMMLAEQQKGIASQGGGQAAKMGMDQVSGAMDGFGKIGEKKGGGEKK